VTPSLVADLLIHHARTLITCAGPAPRRGSDQGRLSVIEDGAVASRSGRIVFAGTTDEADARIVRSPDCDLIDASGCAVLPGFVDPHTHLVFAGDRRDELRRRLAGESYAQIAAGGGGILETVRATRDADETSLIEQARARLDEMLACGTTTCEAKSGYGLTLDSELKLLRVVRALDRTHPIDLVPTFMGAHDVPLDYRDRRGAYVDLVVDEMLPAVAESHLAEWCDVFCETGAFTPPESRRILEAGRRAGLQPRIHADELGPSGGWRVAVDVRARSADHLVFADREAAQAMARAGVVATLLPSAAFYLAIGRFAPARLLIDHDVPVAIATDVNPGGGFSPSMPFAQTVACFAMGMTFEEALVGATINAAYAIDRDAHVGSLEPGKQMDVVIVQGEPIDLIRVGPSAVRIVVKKGRRVVADSRVVRT
jgi:imidazolonepropionase